VALVAAVCVSSVAVFTAHLMMPQPDFNLSSFVSSALPEKVGEFSGDVPWFCHNPQCLQVAEASSLLKKGKRPGEEGFVCPSCGGPLYGISLGESTDLPKDTVILKRNYRAPDGFDCSVNVVIGGRNRSSIHRPELCLPAQGFAMLDAGRKSLKMAGRGPLTVRRIVMKKEGMSSRSLIYWFLSRERETCSHTRRILLDVWDRSVHNRINRWVMISVNVSSDLATPESEERLASFLSELYPQLVVDR
jgi:EpsI family protein